MSGHHKWDDVRRTAPDEPVQPSGTGLESPPDRFKVPGTAPEHAHSACEHANEQALRDRIRDTIHAAVPTCVDYHAADCADCAVRAHAAMAVVRPVLDAKLLTRRTETLRRRAEAAEERLRDQNGHHT